MPAFLSGISRLWNAAGQSRAPITRYRSGIVMAASGVLLVCGLNWFVAHRLNSNRQNLDIQVRAARMRELRSTPEYQIRRVEERLKSPEVLFALRTSEAAQVFTAAAASLIHPERQTVALTTSHLMAHMLDLDLVPPQCRYIPPTEPLNDLRVPMLVSQLSGAVYIPYWDGRYLVVGALPVNEHDGEAFFIRYPDTWQEQTVPVMWTAPTLNHPIVPPNATDLTLRQNGWVKSPLPFNTNLSSLDRTRISLDMLVGEQVGQNPKARSR